MEYEWDENKRKSNLEKHGLASVGWVEVRNPPFDLL
jgi:uncharacterized DUF497 family protein